MPATTQPKDIRTLAYVLRRTNYGEADRILNLLTKNSKVAAIAKGVRREKSKLAGNIEMFCKIDLNIHQGKSEFGVITGATMVEAYTKIATDLSSLELASLILKKINAAAEHSDNPEFFEILNQVFPAINNGAPLDTVETWFWFNLAKATGEEVNLYRDVAGQKLSPDATYHWDFAESALREDPQGNIACDDIQIMRLMLTSKLATVLHVQNIAAKIPAILDISKSINHI